MRSSSVFSSKQSTMDTIRVSLLLTILIVLQIQTGTVFGQKVTKGSLVFVIDNTRSMWDDISQVRDGASQIFDTVLKAKDSQIQDYVVVTFNDPGTQVWTRTEDKATLQSTVNLLQVTRGNRDCPELAMEGIEVALENSLPFSYIYVFTDASAKDYDKYEQVKRIAQKKQSQIVFALTGECGGGRNQPQYQVYHKIAEDTSGQVFHIDKGQVKDILNYVKETVNGRGNVISSQKFPNGQGQFNFPIDGKTGSTTIAVSGYHPKVEVYGPDGIQPKVDTIVDTNEAKIVKLTDPKPGTYRVVVGSNSGTSVLVTGKTNIYFQHGFSPFAPTSISDTATRPAAAGNTFLSIKLVGEGVTLKSARILNMDNSIFAELPLEVINDKEQFYATKDFNPPNTAFRIEVVGHDANNVEVIRRSQTSIERLSPLYKDKEENVRMAPTITLPGGPEVTLEYEAPLELRCGVRANPEPTINWQEMETGVSLPATVYKLEGNDYMSILDVKKSEKNCTYQCKASNTQGTDSKNVAVVTQIYFDVIEIPQNQTIEYNTTGQFTCKVHALPSASITWYKDSEIIGSDANIVISDDASVITIKQMQLHLVGNYKCKASNKFTTEEFNFHVGISAVETPKIDKLVVAVMHALKGTHVELPCKLAQGKPKPAIRWEFRDKPTNTFRELQKYTETIELGDVTTDDTGSYKCTAENVMGSDQMIVDLIIEYPPTIKQDEENMSVKDGEVVTMTCEVDGVPSPSVEWHNNEVMIINSQIYRISEDNSLRFNATPNDIGQYTCVADNGIGTAMKHVYLDVYETPKIDKDVEDVMHARIGTYAELTCSLVQGNPKPEIRWEFRDKPTNNFRELQKYTETIELGDVTTDDTGSYKCTAENIMGSDQMIVDLIVEYPPTIKQDNKENILAKDGDMVTLPCEVDGEPSPTVKWYRNDDTINDPETYLISEDHSMRFNATLNEIGHYKCVAENSLGTSMKTVEVDVYVPVTIDRPDTTTINTMVGEDVALPCTAYGYPEPIIEWLLQDSDFGVIDRLYNIVGTSLVIPRAQIADEGAYTCSASNVGGSVNLTYTVNVIAAPTIQNMYISKNFEAVVGDLALRINCNTTGRPKPTISWKKDGSIITFDTDGYDQAEDGSIIIKNISLDSQGIYVCRAENTVGKHSDTYVVNVKDYPQYQRNQAVTHKLIEDGTSINIDCPIPHKNTDRIRWYKENLGLLPLDELRFNTIMRTDAGAYVCRVSNSFESRSALVNIAIGNKPVFTSEEQENVTDVVTPLVCEASGDPEPTVVWRYNGTYITILQSKTTFTLKEGIEIGQYECVVTNALGNISRAFNVKQIDCMLHTSHDFYTSKQPLMISETPEWPLYKVNKQGNIVMKKNTVIHLNCPNGLRGMPSKLKNIPAICVEGSKFYVGGKVLEYSSIECTRDIEPKKKWTKRRKCLGQNRLWQIGFRVSGDFSPVYDVCASQDNLPLYTVHKLQPGLTDVRRDVAKWTSKTNLFSDAMFDCGNPARTSHINDQWCFENRQLVNYRDLHPNIPVTASFDDWNLVTQWTSCNSKNWDEVEKRVRSLATASRVDLLVYTGAFEQLQLRDNSTVCSKTKQPVMQYIWKVVVDQTIAASLAIIQVNVPGLSSPADASPYVFCDDICNNTIWMKNSEWRDVAKGYVFCCNTKQFDEIIKNKYEKKIGIRNKRILYNARISN